MKGTYNKYTCKAGHDTITIDRDEDTTPAIMDCLTCGESAHSHFYRVAESRAALDHCQKICEHEWYLPEVKDFKRFGTAIVQHVEMGGLLLRHIETKELVQ